MPSIMADHNIEGHFVELLRIWTSEAWKSVWESLAWEVESFARLGIPHDTSGILPFSLALLNALREHGTGQTKERPAVRCLNILFVDKLIEICLAAIVTPDFRHTQGRIYGKLVL